MYREYIYIVLWESRSWTWKTIPQLYDAILIGITPQWSDDRNRAVKLVQWAMQSCSPQKLSFWLCFRAMANSMKMKIGSALVVLSACTVHIMHFSNASQNHTLCIFLRPRQMKPQFLITHSTLAPPYLRCARCNAAGILKNWQPVMQSIWPQGNVV